MGDVQTNLLSATLNFHGQPVNGLISSPIEPPMYHILEHFPFAIVLLAETSERNEKREYVSTKRMLWNMRHVRSIFIQQILIYWWIPSSSPKVENANASRWFYIFLLCSSRAGTMYDTFFYCLTLPIFNTVKKCRKNVLNKIMNIVDNRQISQFRFIWLFCLPHLYWSNTFFSVFGIYFFFWIF